MDVDLNSQLTLKLALQLAGGALVVAAAFAAWIYSQFVKPQLDDQAKRLRELEVTSATRIGLLDEVKTIDGTVRTLENKVSVLDASESQRNLKLNQGLDQLSELNKRLKQEMAHGDLESRVATAETLIRTLAVAGTLAKLQSQEAREKVAAELAEANAQLDRLRKQRSATPPPP